MRVSIVRGGGLAGLVRRTELRSDELAADDADTLSRLVADSGLQAAPGSPAPSLQPDEMSYEVGVEPDDGPGQNARFSESAMPVAVRELIAWVDARPERKDSLLPPGARRP